MSDATQPNPQPAEELERVLAELRLVLAAALVGWEDVDGQDLRGTRLMFEGVYSKVAQYVTPAFAALARERELREALVESVKLQSHYAALLNEYDGGQRMEFTVESWLERLALFAQPAAGEERERG